MRKFTAKAREARLEVETEVFGLFRDINPAEAMGEGRELETVRGRSGCVPDLPIVGGWGRGGGGGWGVWDTFRF